MPRTPGPDAIRVDACEETDHSTEESSRERPNRQEMDTGKSQDQGVQRPEATVKHPAAIAVSTPGQTYGPV